MADPSSDSPSDRGATPLLHTVATLARSLIRIVQGLALTSTCAGILLWGLLWWPVSFHTASLVGASLTLIVLLSSAAVLGLFYVGLRDLAALPNHLSDHAARTVEASSETYRAATETFDTWRARLYHLVWRLWSLQSLISDHRALLLRYGAMLRFATPGFLFLVLIATGASLLIVPGAVLAIVLTWGL